MTKLAIIDLDGVVANADARFERADLVKEQWLMERQKGLPYAVNPDTEKAATNVYWREVFNPENVELDTLIEGVNEAVMDIQRKGYKTVFLTSRPESMRRATFQWLIEHTTYGSYDELVMKPAGFQYTKTVIWKAGTIQMFVAMYGADDILVIDDEPANLAELMKYDTAHYRLCASLAEAIAPVPEDEHPF